MEKVQIIPPPKDVDPRVLAWKGAAVLGKMDSVADLWISPDDWVRIIVTMRFFQDIRLTLVLMVIQDVFGMRALRERCFFL